jgi:hypothetical protein
MQKLRDAILANHPGSRLEPMTAGKMERLAAEHPKLPANLRDFFAEVGVDVKTCGFRDQIDAPREPPLQSRRSLLRRKTLICRRSSGGASIAGFGCVNTGVASEFP